MRIIKNGRRDNNTVKFVCKECHCEFECTKDEYWENQNTISLTYPISNECFANCPQCHKICRVYATKHDYNTSVTGTCATKVSNVHNEY